MEIEIEVAGGVMHAWRADPDRPDGSAVLVLMEAFGVNEHIRSVCARFATRGSVAIAPDLYHRQGRFLTGEYADPAAIMPAFGRLTEADLAADVRASMGVLAADPVVDADHIGVIGFCLGGWTAVLAAITSSPAVAAGFYGAGLSIPRAGSPLPALAPRFGEIGCPLLLFYGEDDPVIPMEEVAATRDALAVAGVDAEVRTYSRAGHGFFCDARGSYVPAAADDAWSRVTDAFSRQLGWSS